MSDKKSIDLGLTSALDELFMDEQGRKENALPKIYDIPLSEIDDFPDHPFHVRNDEDMDQLVDSIKERGIITFLNGVPPFIYHFASTRTDFKIRTIPTIYRTVEFFHFLFPLSFDKSIITD